MHGSYLQGMETADGAVTCWVHEKGTDPTYKEWKLSTLLSWNSSSISTDPTYKEWKLLYLLRVNHF